VNLILLFDGVCNLCNASVNFVIDHDPQGRIRFATLQSEEGKREIARLDPSGKTAAIDCVVLLEDDRIWTCSSAALRVAYHLGGLWSLLYAFIIVPRFIRDGVYRIIAKYRYRWFGRTEACRIPTPALRARFLDAPPGPSAAHA
jgi:predicted DCC family thiol-disulfide oxidoreductase YuxK